MLSVTQAQSAILNALPKPLTTESDLAEALGCALAEDVMATNAVPPFRSSAVDGYAVHAADVSRIPVQLPVVMDVPAGTMPGTPLPPQSAARVLTGAPIPDGADAVVMVEDTDAAWRADPTAPLAAHVTIHKAVDVGSGVRPIGESVRVGQVVLHQGRVLGAADLGVLAALGWASVRVWRRPLVAVLSTGDELVPPGGTLQPGQIYDANSTMLAAMVREQGGIPLVLPHAPDDEPEVRARLKAATDAGAALILSSAGVSVGAHDVVRAAVEAVGTLTFWRVNMRPGKPLAFGQVHGLPFIGLPGNPVSAGVTFELFVRPAIRALAALPDVPQHLTAIADEDFTSDRRESYLRVSLHQHHGQWYARSTGTQSSGALLSLVLADGLLMMAAGTGAVTRGEAVTVRLLRPLRPVVVGDIPQG